MEKTCSVHSRPYVAVCLHNDCELKCLCLECFKEHPQIHGSDIKEVSILLENNTCTKRYEKDIDNVFKSVTNLANENENLFVQSKTLIEGMFEDIKASLETKKLGLIQELENAFFINSSALFSINQNLKEYVKDCSKDDPENFYKKLDKIRAIPDSLLPKTNKNLDRINNSITQLELNTTNVTSFQEQIVMNIENCSLATFVSQNSWIEVSDGEEEESYGQEEEDDERTFDNQVLEFRRLIDLNEQLVEKKKKR